MPRLATLFLIFTAVAAASAATATRRLPPGATSLPSPTGLLTVTLRDNTPDADLGAVLASTGAAEVRRIPALHAVAVQARPGTEAATLAALRAHPAVRAAEHDLTASTATTSPSTTSPQAPNAAAVHQWNIDLVQAWQAWELLPASATTTVAVIDSGVDASHPDLSGRVLDGCNQKYGPCTGGGGNRPAGYESSHGTHVAGIIAAATNAANGIVSVSGGRITILPINVFAVHRTMTTASLVADAIVWATDRGVKVINISIGFGCGSPQSTVLSNAITYATQRDVIIVVSAGNEANCNAVSYPRNDPRVLAVAAVDPADKPARFSDDAGFVFAAAPGVGVYSTAPGAGYREASGTSMAAPHVAALAALLSQVPGATKAKVVDWIRQTCDAKAFVNQCGGRINVYRAVTLAVTGIDPGPWQEATPIPAPALTSGSAPASGATPTAELAVTPTS